MASRLAFWLLVAGATWCPAGAGAAEADWPGLLARTAAQIWDAAGSHRRVAARPVDPDETGLPLDITRRLDAALTEALLRAAPAEGRLVERAALPATWEEAISFQGLSAEDLLRDAAVDALVVPRAHAAADGIALSATVVAVGGGDTGRLLATVPAVALPGAVEGLIARPPAVAARIAGSALADALRLGLDASGRFQVSIRLAGERSAFGDWFLDQVAERLIGRLAERPLYITRPLRRAGGNAASLPVRLDAEIWDHGDRIDAHLRAVADGVEARTAARIDPKALPVHFLPLTPDGGRVASGYRIADGAASLGPELRRDELGVAAEAIARAMLVDDALDRRPPMPSIARSRSDVAEALKRFERAVPYDETWSGSATGPDAAARRLRARAAKLGGPEAPALTAALDQDVYRPGDAVRLRAEAAAGRIFVAVYVWQADGSVVRIVPAGGRGPVTIEAGRRVELPGAKEPQVLAAPMPGMTESLEAVMVVASTVPFDPDHLAPPVGRSVAASRQAAAAAGAFLARVAELDRERLRLVVLPYRVRKG